MDANVTLFHFDDGRQSFEDIGLPNGATHWREEDVMRALGYQTAQGFRKALTRAKQTCLTLGLQCEEHFALQQNGSHLLTRFGCYLVAMNGDNKKPEVAAAQAYFATIAQTFQTRIEHADGIDRLLIRDEVTDGQKSLASTAKAAGVVNYAFFQNKGYLGMYNMTLDRLCEFKGVPEGQKLVDRMGKAELAAHLFRITQTDEKIKNDSARGQAALERVAFDVGRKVRHTIEELSGTSPEHLPIAAPLSEVKKKLKGTNRTLASLDKKDKKKRPPE